MKVILFSAVCFFLLVARCPAGYTIPNGDFEDAVVHIQDPTFGWLAWNEAIPGWGHSEGEGTECVYYGYTHLGDVQWFLLVDAHPNVHGLTVLQGSYSVALHSGYDSPECGEWVHACLSRVCTVPTGQVGIRLLAAEGNFRVCFDDETIAMVAQGGDEYLGNMSRFAGQTGVLKIIDQTPYADYGYVVVDAISFQPIPEPASFSLLVSGLLLAPLVKRRRLHG